MGALFRTSNIHDFCRILSPKKKRWEFDLIKKSVRTGQAQLNGVKSEDGAAQLGKLTGRMGFFWCGLMLAVWVFRCI